MSDLRLNIIGKEVMRRQIDILILTGITFDCHSMLLTSQGIGSVFELGVFNFH